MIAHIDEFPPSDAPEASWATWGCTNATNCYIDTALEEHLSRVEQWWRELFRVALADLRLTWQPRWRSRRVWYHRKSNPRWSTRRWKAKT